MERTHTRPSEVVSETLLASGFAHQPTLRAVGTFLENISSRGVLKEGKVININLYTMGSFWKDKKNSVLKLYFRLHTKHLYVVTIHRVQTP